MGADGGKSVIRQSLSASEPRKWGYIGWRGLVDQVPSGWENGRITEFGDHHQLLAAAGAYASLWRSWQGDDDSDGTSQSTSPTADH